MMSQQPIEYPFPTDPAATSYLIFPPELEDDEHVFFHGTADAVRVSILTEGFRIPAPPRAQSVSFAKTSTLSLRFASEARSEVSPNGCIFVVRYTRASLASQLQRSVARDLVMLHGLSGRQQASIERRRAFVFLQDLMPFLNNPVDCGTGFALSALAPKANRERLSVQEAIQTAIAARTRIMPPTSVAYI